MTSCHASDGSWQYKTPAGTFSGEAFLFPQELFHAECISGSGIAPCARQGSEARQQADCLAKFISRMQLVLKVSRPNQNLPNQRQHSNGKKLTSQSIYLKLYIGRFDFALPPSDRVPQRLSGQQLCRTAYHEQRRPNLVQNKLTHHPYQSSTHQLCHSSF